MTWVFNASQEVDDASNYPTIIAVSVTFCVLMLIVVTARGVFRLNVLGLDDVAIFITAACSVTYTALCMYQTRWGLGLPLALRPVKDTHVLKKLSYAGKPWYPLSLAGYKIALCIGYLRFLEGSDLRRYRMVTIAVGAGSAIIQLIFVLINLFNCMPISKSFDSTVPGYCLPFPQVQYPMAVISILCDVIVFLLPIPLFMRLSLNRNSILGLSMLFGCGLVTTVASIARACYLKDVGPSGNGDNTMVVVLGSVEANVGIIMSCLPFLKTLLTAMLRKGGRSVVGYRADRKHPATRTVPDYTLDLFGSDGKSKSHTTAERGRSTSLTGSEELILHGHHGVGLPQGIIKSTKVHVTVEDGLS